jgi:hypothetical protein
MRNFGLLLMVVGVATYLYCTSQMSGLQPLGENADLADYFRNAAGRFELGRFAGAGAALIGILMAFFPQGR